MRLAGAGGVIVGLAIDHRDSLDALLRQRGVGALDTAAMQDQKVAIVAALAPLATAVMLDPHYGRRAIDERAYGQAALIMPLEAQGYAALGDERRTTLLDGFSPARARDLGAVACKLLVPMRPDREAFTEAQLSVTAAALEATHAAGLAMVLEPLVYRASAESEAVFSTAYPDLVVDAVGRLAALGPDLLKLPVPTPPGAAPAPDRDAYARMAAAARPVPWVLYGAGLPVESLVAELAAAGAAGAVGFLVGRTIWGDLVARDASQTAAATATIGRDRFLRLARTARRRARPLGRPPAGVTSIPSLNDVPYRGDA